MFMLLSCQGRRFFECTTLERLHIVVSVVGLLIGLGFAVYGIITDHFQSDDSSYLFVFAVNCCFALIYTVKGIKHEDPYDIGIIVLSVAPTVIYALIDFFTGERTTFKRVNLFYYFALFIGGFGIYHLVKFLKSKNFIARHDVIISSSVKNDDFSRPSNEADQTRNENLRHCLRTMLLFYFLLSVNLQVDLSAAVFTLTSGYAIRLDSGDFIHKDMFVLFFAVIIIALLAWIFGYFSAKHERKIWIFYFGLSSVFLVATGMYLLVQAAGDVHNTDVNDTLCRVTLFTGILMVFLRVITCTACYLAYKNFGKGLRETVYGQNGSQNPLIERRSKTRQYSTTDN